MHKNDGAGKGKSFQEDSPSGPSLAQFEKLVMNGVRQIGKNERRIQPTPDSPSVVEGEASRVQAGGVVEQGLAEIPSSATRSALSHTGPGAIAIDTLLPRSVPFRIAGGAGRDSEDLKRSPPVALVGLRRAIWVPLERGV